MKCMCPSSVERVMKGFMSDSREAFNGALPYASSLEPPKVRLKPWPVSPGRAVPLKALPKIMAQNQTRNGILRGGLP
jgi:hypothetical protein